MYKIGAYIAGPDSLLKRANDNIEKYRVNRQEFLQLYLDSIVAKIEELVLKESRMSGKSQIDNFDLLSVSLPVIPNIKINPDKLREVEADWVIDQVVAWLTKEGITVKHVYDKSPIFSLRARLNLAWTMPTSGLTEAKK